jgi:hypothetical protein
MALAKGNQIFRILYTYDIHRKPDFLKSFFTPKKNRLCNAAGFRVQFS